VSSAKPNNSCRAHGLRLAFNAVAVTPTSKGPCLACRSKTLVVRGGIVWQLQDLRQGAGSGVIDALGTPKSAWHGLALVLLPITALITDEDLDGLAVHLINETAAPIYAHLELACLRDGATKVARAWKDVTLAARSTARIQASDLLGQFFDFTYAYRVGPRPRCHRDYLA
jgi:hypothetical protein